MNCETWGIINLQRYQPAAGQRWDRNWCGWRQNSSHHVYTETKFKQMPFCTYFYPLIKNLDKIQKNVRKVKQSARHELVCFFCVFAARAKVLSCVVLSNTFFWFTLFGCLETETSTLLVMLSFSGIPGKRNNKYCK